MAKKPFPFLNQLDSKNSGQDCLRIISKYYGKSFSSNQINELSRSQKIENNILNLSLVAESIGYKSQRVNVSLQKLTKAPLPCILFWNTDYYVVLYKYKNNTFCISDPVRGLLTYTSKDFLNGWIGSKTDASSSKNGIVLLIEPTSRFYKDNGDEEEGELGFSFVSQYLVKYKKFLIQMIFGLLAASLIQLAAPFLVQSIIDVGIKNQDIQFIYLVLFAQLALFLGRTAIEVVQGWILLHLSTRINISLISDFFIKLMKLPIAFFDARMTGDILQRIYDHKRIEGVLTITSLKVLFSTINLLVFGMVLAFYSFNIFWIFLVGSLFFFGWIILFLKKRRKLDFEKFSQQSKEHSKIIELINGMQTIKLNNVEREKRWGWEFLQARLFKISIQVLSLEQYQNAGSSFINELKNILISLLSAKLVIDGNITLGMMIAISYIVGQLNQPISQIVGFIREYQDAKISFERIAEIHNKQNEESDLEEKITVLPYKMDLIIEDLSFRYIGYPNNILQSVTLRIPKNKITAIVGQSGSGKTTLMKLLMKFYEPTHGTIRLGSNKLKDVSQKTWRDKCGVVMQEDFIFNDTIAKNIALEADYINEERLKYAVDVANIKEFIEELPQGYNTKIGSEGMSTSTGQRQRLLIARAVYKNPDYLFFDEATSALDTENEKVILNRLDDFYEDKTVVVVAHRLSTVKNAYQVVVLDAGKVVEVGSHQELIRRKGNYYKLVKNQLELGA